jgi:8-oxo-dGTP diphosphatase
MQNATLCLPICHRPARAVLLGYKKRGFGQGKYMGFGGKVATGESGLGAALRELHEEAGLVATPAGLTALGAVTFCFPARPAWSQQVQIFLVWRWSGAPQESDEMAPAWFAPDHLPYNQMWRDAPYWLPQALNGQVLKLSISFAADNETVDQVVYRAAEPAAL